jgi:hypothetical protein
MYTYCKHIVCTRCNRLWAQRNLLWGQRNLLRAQRNLLRAQRNLLWAQRNLLKHPKCRQEAPNELPSTKRAHPGHFPRAPEVPSKSQRGRRSARPGAAGAAADTAHWVAGTDNTAAARGAALAPAPRTKAGP